jgi:hypothetical protein
MNEGSSATPPAGEHEVKERLRRIDGFGAGTFR